MTENNDHQNDDSLPPRCIVCEQTTVERFLDLGPTALANKFLGRDELSLEAAEA